MGRILEYVILLSSLSLIRAVQQFKDSSPHGSDRGREKQENLTHAVTQLFPKEQNDFFNKRVLPLDFQGGRRPLPPRPKIGLHAFASNDHDRKGRKAEPNNIGFSNSRRAVVPSYSQALHPRKNSKTFGEIPFQRLSKVYNPNNSVNHHSKQTEDYGRRHYKEGKNARYQPHHAAKICDPCNSVPWVPLLKVPDSYRKQRTHVTELHPTPHQNLNFDFHGFASNTHNVLIPPVPLAPPIYDGTISSSFGLPIGNIPTSHGLLAPINHLTTYPTNTIDYSNSFNYYSPHGLLDSHPFPELSPVPIVPIHDSGSFYQFDSGIADLVPPPTKGLDVSKVVLTISEENSANLEPPKPENPKNHKPSKDLNPGGSAVDSQIFHSHTKDKSQNNFGSLEIVKSVPLAEFTSSVSSHHQHLPLYPPLQTDAKDFHSQKPVRHSNSNFDVLIPPQRSHAEFTFNTTKSVTTSSHLTPPEKSELREESAPKPLTSPSLSWLFSDHTAPPDDSKSSGSVPVSSYATEALEIASVVNNELRPVSPHPLPVSSPPAPNVGNAKSKKIQIIIPYTTKNKNGRDNNAIESVRHEVFQPPVTENNSLRDSATSLPPLTHPNPDMKVIDGFANQFKTENQQLEEDKSHKYLSEMHHIIASNIRELLKEEIQKSQTDQNYPLQNNIDNWTALEYSNHKTVETIAPKEILNQALAVTSIPGTSISHLLLPSKKIPNEYFVTTPVPVFDEPSTTIYKATNSTVNSSPFTAKPYATTSIYNPTRGHDDKLVVGQTNHEQNYTEVGRGKVNNWGRLNENFVVPEARSKTRGIEQATTSGWSSNFYSSSGSEKVQIVTPISLTTQRNYTTASFRRTTRHVHKTEMPTTESSKLLGKLNSTRLEKVSNQTSPFNRKFTYNSTIIRMVNSSENVVKVERTNDSVLAETNVTVLPKDLTSEKVKLSSGNEHLSINDIIPFRTKELPWGSNSNSSQNVLRIPRQRKTLIKQANLPKSKPVPSSS